VADTNTVLESVPYEYVDGRETGRQVSVYALSTCAFCRKAMDFLRENGVGFRFVYVDSLEQDIKLELKKALRARFDRITLYPLLVVGDDVAISGFTAAKWGETIGIDP
jgi:glutaredoxin-like protein NrdH